MKNEIAQKYGFHTDITNLNLLIVDEDGNTVDLSVLADYVVEVEAKEHGTA